MKIFAIPVMTGATGIETKGLKEYPKIIPEKRSVGSVPRNSCTRDITHNKESATV